MKSQVNFPMTMLFCKEFFLVHLGQEKISYIWNHLPCQGEYFKTWMGNKSNRNIFDNYFQADGFWRSVETIWQLKLKETISSVS